MRHISAVMAILSAISIGFASVNAQERINVSNSRTITLTYGNRGVVNLDLFEVCIDNVKYFYQSGLQSFMTPKFNENGKIENCTPIKKEKTQFNKDGLLDNPNY